MNIFNVIKSQTIEIPFFKRVFEFDGLDSSTSPGRIATIALPFLSLYRPFGSTINLVMGTRRVIHHFAEGKLIEGSLSVIAVTSTFFHSQGGLIFTTGIDLIKTLIQLKEQLSNNKKMEAFGSFLQAASLALYLPLLFKNSRKVVLVSIVSEIALQLFQAYQEKTKLRWPEMCGKLGMASIRFYQGYSHYQLMKGEELLQASLQTNKLRAALNILRAKVARARSGKGEESEESSDSEFFVQNESNGETKYFDRETELGENESRFSSPFDFLNDVETNIDGLSREKKEEILEALSREAFDDFETYKRRYTREELRDADRRLRSLLGYDENDDFYEYDPGEPEFPNLDDPIALFGVNQSEVGNDLVKGMNLTFRQKRNTYSLEFKLNKVHRDRLEKALQEVALAADDRLIKVEKVPTTSIPREINHYSITDHKFTFKDLGTFYIGAAPTSSTTYNKVRVVVNEKKGLPAMHKILSKFNLEGVFEPSSEEAIERMKIGQLFRVFHPKKAQMLAKTEEFFDLPIENLKAKIIESAPEMKTSFETHLHEMKPYEICPGKNRFAIPTLNREVYQLGARALTSSIGGSITAATERALNILKVGMLSSEARFAAGINVKGMSSGADFMDGGGDSVFTQLVTDSLIKRTFNIKNLYYGGYIRFLFPLSS